MSKSIDEVIKEFNNYAVGFKDFHMDAIESFPGVDFNSIKFPTTAKSSLVHMSSEDVNFEDDASTPHLSNDNTKSRGVILSGLSP